MNNGRKEICTIGLIAVNVCVFLILSLKGETENAQFMLEHGAMYAPYIIDGREYYRIFTSQFMHFGIEHLMNNMVMLGAIGWSLEPCLGRIKFLMVYLISGLAGNIISLSVNMSIGRNPISAGASGAVFGLMGALLAVVAKNRGRLYRFTKGRMFFMVFLSLYFGFTSSGVDNAAHVGGLLFGFIFAWLLYRKPNHERRAAF